MSNGKSKKKPNTIDTGDHFPSVVDDDGERIITDEKQVAEEFRDTEKHGWTHSRKTGVITRLPKCPKCGIYLSQVKVDGKLVEITDDGTLTTTKYSNPNREIKPKAVQPTTPTVSHPPSHKYNYKKFFIFLLSIILPVVIFFGYRYFISHSGERMPISVMITRFKDVSGYFAIEGTAENNLAPVEARPIARFYDNFGKVIFTKRFPKVFFNTGITPIMLSVKNHKSVEEVEVFIEK